MVSAMHITIEAIKKSKNCDIIEEKGNNSLGKYILVTRFVLEIKDKVEKRILATKNAHGTAFTETDAISASSVGFPDTTENANLTSIPAATMSIGMNMAHNMPITDCLYLILISRQASM